MNIVDKVGKDSTITSKTSSGLDTPCQAYMEMEKEWLLPEALMSGTLGMRKGREKWLPREVRESAEAYEIRLNRTVLYNVYKRTINSLAGNAFQKNVMVSNLPEELEPIQWNADGNGSTLTELAYDLFKDSMIYGKAHALIDHPIMRREEGLPEMTLTEYRNSGLRPYLTRISPRNLFYWSYHTEHGRIIIDQIRIFEETVEQSLEDEFSEKVVRYIRVIEPNLLRVFRLDPEVETDWYELPAEYTTFDQVPLLTAYTERTGFLESNPPLGDLAWLNLRHWQSQSDQANILHVARVPILFASGFSEDSLEGLTIGANHLVVSDDVESRLSYTEHSGAAIASGRQDLLDLQDHMSNLGADIVIRKGVSRQTATARMADQAESLSVIQLTLRNIERMFEDFFIKAGEMLGVDASDVTVRIGGDLGLFTDPNSYSSLENLRTTLGLEQHEVIELAKSLNIIPSYMNPKGDWKPEPEPTEEIIVKESETSEDGDDSDTDKQ